MGAMTKPGIERQEDKSSDFRRIAVATDFSASAEKALNYALVVAKRYHGEITLVHAVAREPRQAAPMYHLPREIDPVYQKANIKMLRLDLQPCLMQVPHHAVLQYGAAPHVLSSVSNDEKTDLLVVGTRGRTGLTKMALGSVAEEVLRVANCPVLTVGPLAPAAPKVPDFKTILFATDFGPASDPSFQYAASIAERFNAKLTLLHTFLPIPEFKTVPGHTPPAASAEAVSQWERQVHAEALSKLKTLVSSYSKPLEAEYAVIMDFSPTAILDFMARHKPELLVMGAHRPQSPRLVAHLPWGNLHGILCGAHCPVLTVLA